MTGHDLLWHLDRMKSEIALTVIPLPLRTARLNAPTFSLRYKELEY